MAGMAAKRSSPYFLSLIPLSFDESQHDLQDVSLRVGEEMKTGGSPTTHAFTILLALTAPILFLVVSVEGQTPLVGGPGGGEFTPAVRLAGFWRCKCA